MSIPPGLPPAAVPIEEVPAAVAATCRDKLPAYAVPAHIVQAGIAYGGHREAWVEESKHVDALLASLSANPPAHQGK